MISNESDSTIFLKPTDKEEMANISSIIVRLLAQKVYLLISSKKWNFKAIGRFIQPLCHDWCFPFVLKTAKIVPILRNVQN